MFKFSTLSLHLELTSTDWWLRSSFEQSVLYPRTNEHGLVAPEFFRAIRALYPLINEHGLVAPEFFRAIRALSANERARIGRK